jgi:hypothetical protein
MFSSCGARHHPSEADMAQRCRELSAGDRRITRMSDRAAWAAALLAATGSLAGSATAAGRTRPDLGETRVIPSVRAVQVGGSLRVTDTVVNRGGGRAPRSTTGFFIGARSHALARRLVPALRQHRISRGSTTLQIRNSFAPGTYRVLACADVAHRVGESNEANNCRASSVVEVTAAPGADRSPPRFAGLKAATTCIPGPIVRGRTSSYHLRWDPASDNVTPSSEIVYDVFQSTKAGDEKLSTPTYTTPAGAESFTTPPLSADATYFFLVRARDGAGNRDSNRVERVGENICL